MTSETFTIIIASLLIFALIAKLWLNLRQQRFVTAHRGAVPQPFAAQVDLEAHQKAADYLCAQSKLSRVDIVLGTILFLALTWGGGLAWFNHFWDGYFASAILRGVALIASIAFISMLLDLPLAAYRSFSLEARFGFNRMTPKLFCQDLLKNTLLAIILGLPLLALILWLMTAAGNFWWFYAWLVLAGFNLLMMVIYPIWIAPWFNRFTPLAAGEARERIEQLLKRGNFSARDIFVIDGSRRSSHGNAYFTGFGKSRRIVFFDTLLEGLTPLQIEAVLAHELGHFHHRHIIKRISLVFVCSLVFFALLGHLMHAPWFFAALGVGAESAGNAALALLLFTLVVPLFSFFFTPLFSHLSRRDEFQADDYASRMSSAAALAEALVKMYKDNASTLTPDPLYSRFYDSHPPASLRVARLVAFAPATTASPVTDSDDVI